MNKMSSVTIKFIRTNFNKHPIISNSVIYGALFLGAECTQQVLTKRTLADEPKVLDVTSLTRYALFGTAIQGPLLTVWFKWLDSKFIGKSLTVVGKKLVLDQTIAASGELLLFYLAMSIMEGKQDVFEECRSKFVESYKSSCLFWIPAQVVNFLMVPPAFRVIYFGVASFAWVNILCYIKRQDY